MKIAAIVLALLSFPSYAYGPYPAAVLEVTSYDTFFISVDAWPGVTLNAKVTLPRLYGPSKTSHEPCEVEARRAARRLVADFTRGAACVVDSAGFPKSGGTMSAELTCDGVAIRDLLEQHGYTRQPIAGFPGPWCSQ